MGGLHMTLKGMIQRPNMMELLLDRYLWIEAAFEKAWEEQSDLAISQTEWKILGRIERDGLPVARITKNLHITRQAIHKLIKNLSAKGLIELYPMENNKKERCIALTELGHECYDIYTNIHAHIENQIAANIGAGEMESLKATLQSDWGL